MKKVITTFLVVMLCLSFASVAHAEAPMPMPEPTYPTEPPETAEGDSWASPMRWLTIYLEDEPLLLGIPSKEGIDATREHYGDDEYLEYLIKGWLRADPSRSQFVSDLIVFSSVADIDIETVLPLVHTRTDWNDLDFEVQKDGQFRVEEVSDHYQMAWAYQHGLVDGDGQGNLRPDEPITNYEAIALMARVMSAVNKTRPFPPTRIGNYEEPPWTDVPNWVEVEYQIFFRYTGVYWYPNGEWNLVNSWQIISTLARVGIGEGIERQYYKMSVSLPVTAEGN